MLASNSTSLFVYHERTVPCVNALCCVVVVRAQCMKKHLEKCLYSEVPCSYQKFGCKVKVFRKDITAHEADHKIYSKVALEAMAAMKAKMSTMESKIGTMEGTIGFMQGRIDSLESKLGIMEANVVTLEEALEDRLYDDGFEVEVEGNEHVVVQEGPQEYHMEDEGGKSEEEEGGKQPEEEEGGKPEEEEGGKQLEEEQRHVEKKDVTFKFCNKDGACGKFYSPPFYSSTNGYHMRMEAHANGNDDGMGTHLTVGVRLLEGKYNDELHWPFVGSTTCILLNQLEDRNHYKRAIKMESDDHVVAGKGMGYPKFFPLCELAYNPVENTQYVKDETMYFRMSVDIPDHKPWLECSAL